MRLIDRQQAKLPAHKAKDVGNDVYGDARLVLAKQVTSVLNEGALTWFLDGGTLLGAYRMGRVLPQDDDFDTAVYLPDYQGEQDLAELVRDLEAAISPQYRVRVLSSYAHKVEIYDPTSRCYSLPSDEYKGADFHTVTVDIQVMTDGPDDSVVYLHDMLSTVFVPAKTLQPRGEIECDGTVFSCPGDIKGFLGAQYGYLGTDAEFDPLTKRYVRVQAPRACDS